MIRIHAACLPAFCTAHPPVPPPALTKSQNPATAEQLEKANFPLPPPTKKKGGGGKRGGCSGSCFGLSTFHLEAVKRRFLQNARRQGNNPDSPPLIHAPLLPPKHMHICVLPPPPPLPDHRRLSAAAWQKSAGIDAVNGENRVRCFNTVTLGGASQRNVTAMMSSQMGGGEGGGM